MASTARHPSVRAPNLAGGPDLAGGPVTVRSLPGRAPRAMRSRDEVSITDDGVPDVDVDMAWRWGRRP